MGVLSRTTTCSDEMCGWEGMGVLVGVCMDPGAGLAASRLASWSMPSRSAGQHMARRLVARAVLDMTCSKLPMGEGGADGECLEQGHNMLRRLTQRSFAPIGASLLR